MARRHIFIVSGSRHGSMRGCPEDSPLRRSERQLQRCDILIVPGSRHAACAAASKIRDSPAPAGLPLRHRAPRPTNGIGKGDCPVLSSSSSAAPASRHARLLRRSAWRRLPARRRSRRPGDAARRRDAQASV